MIRVMSEAEPFGFFVGRAGEAIDISAFARRIVVEPREVRRGLDELKRRQVCSVDSSGRIYSRRMVREFARREQLRSNSGLVDATTTALVDTKRTALVDTKQNALVATKSSAVVSTSSEHKLCSHVLTRAGFQNPDTRDTDSLRSSALEFGDWPNDVGQLRSLATLFLAAFGNCRDPVKAEKHLGAYTTVLATFSARGASIDDAWRACIDALAAAGGKPLFSSAIRTAIAFLRPMNASGRAKISDEQAEKNRAYLRSVGL